MTKNEAYIKPEISDGYYFHLDTIVAYIKTIESLWRITPIFFASRFSVLLSAHKGLQHKKESVRLLYTWFVSCVISSKTIVLQLPKCDSLFFYSTPKPNWYPQIKVLAERLSQKGFSCALMTRDRIKIYPSGQSDDIPTYSLGRIASITVFFRAVLYTFLLYVYTLIHAPDLYFETLNNPFRVLYEIILSLERLKLADYILQRIRPKLIITNGDHIPFASELIVSKHAKTAHKVWFFNELPTADILPIASDEVWVWNTHVADSFQKLLPQHTNKIFTITGRSEIDFSSLHYICRSKEEKDLLEKTKSKHVLLFLSEYIEGHIFNTFDMTKEAILWLSFAAKSCPDWYVIYKSRPFHHQEQLPGFQFVQNISNVIVPKTSIDLKNYLNWPNVKAVASCGSTGLFTSAGKDIPALRLKVSTKSADMPIIDAISTAIDSPGELIQALKNIGTVRFKNPKKNQEIFPYLGRTIDRMKNIAVSRL